MSVARSNQFNDNYKIVYILSIYGKIIGVFSTITKATMYATKKQYKYDQYKIDDFKIDDSFNNDINFPQTKSQVFPDNSSVTLSSKNNVKENADNKYYDYQGSSFNDIYDYYKKDKEYVSNNIDNYDDDNYDDDNYDDDNYDSQLCDLCNGEDCKRNGECCNDNYSD